MSGSGALPSAEAGQGFEDAPLGMAVTSTHGVLSAVNRALCTLLGRAGEEVRGRPLFEFTHPDDLRSAHQACDSVRTRRAGVWRHECRLVDVEGRPVPVQVTTSWVEPDSDALPHLVMVIDDITERKAAEAALVHRALHDPLTGLPNRLLFHDRLLHALQRGHREGTGTCVLMIDLDDFKGINDRYGHPLGDQVLAAFAGRLSSVLRTSDTAARLGGDEFAVVCEDSRPSDAHALAARLRETLAEPLVLDGAPLFVRFSIGVGSADGDVDPARSILDVVRDADRQMYLDKRRRAG